MAKKMGRPRAAIDQKVFENLCAIQCSRDEVCDFFRITDKTLGVFCKETYGKTFSAVFAQKRTAGKISLRRNMFRLSETNAAVSIFMAKNWLGMRDVPIEEDGAAPATPISVQIIVKDASGVENAEHQS